MPLAEEASAGQAFAVNLLHFVRLLRRAGLNVSSAQAADLATALTLVDLGRRADVYQACAAFVVHGPHEQALFDTVFNLFWAQGNMWVLASGTAPPAKAAENSDERSGASPVESEGDAQEPEAAGPDSVTLETTYSAVALLHQKDFAAYSAEELALAERFVDSLVWQLSDHLTRRRARANKRAAFLDLTQTIRRSLPYGGEMVDLAWQRRKHKPRPLTVICDVSGSMDRYSRIFLHFIYTLARTHQNVEAFVFGTKLTRITPALRHRDIDRCLDEVAATTADWAGGTRIGETLREHNFKWARRTLRSGAVAIIISDGWDRGDLGLLRQEMARLQRSVYRLIWLNPLLGAPDYEPLAQGIQAALPFVDDFLPLHNLASLEALALQLGRHLIVAR